MCVTKPKAVSFRHMSTRHARQCVSFRVVEHYHLAFQLMIRLLRVMEAHHVVLSLIYRKTGRTMLLNQQIFFFFQYDQIKRQNLEILVILYNLNMVITSVPVDLHKLTRANPRIAHLSQNESGFNLHMCKTIPGPLYMVLIIYKL